MAVFVYKALNERGKNVKGVIDAESMKSARQKLKVQGIFPTEISERSATPESSFRLGSKSVRRTAKLNGAQLSVLTRQFSTLVGAGLPLVEALKALGEQVDQTSIRAVLADVTDTVNQGSTLAAALKQHPGVFPKLYTNMVASGESSGSLEHVLSRLADLLEAQAALRRKVVSAMTYPILMLVLCFGVILLLLGYVVPQITSIFEGQGAVLPLPTRIVIGLSDFVKGFWWLLLVAIIGGISSFKVYAKTERGRKRIDRALLRLPLFGVLRLKIASSRLARNLSLMLASGIELLTALTITKNILGNTVLETVVEDAREGVREGKSLASELGSAGIFPRLLIHMVAIGERTGELEQMLQRAADSFDAEVEATLSGLTAILEPLLIIFLAGIVGAILAAVMLPMLEMTSLIR
jgi:general secretion pathway protein F